MIPIFSSVQEHMELLLSLPRPGEENILAWYEHRLGAISREPRLMLIPLDDHLAHRGDGIFETILYMHGKLYGLDEHLKRMRSSAEGIFLSPPCDWDAIRQIIFSVAVAGRELNGLLRILLGRGPGGFSVSPNESPVSSLYVAAYRFNQHPDSWFEKGLQGFRSSIPAKQGYLAKIKNANYLPNVLMMQEAESKGADIPFCFDEEGFLAESATANICLVNQRGELEIPQFSNALIGTTISRAIKLLDGSVPHSLKKITEENVLNAKEVLVLGTGFGCASVVSYEGKNISDGLPGEISTFLRVLIDKDILETGVHIPGL